MGQCRGPQTGSVPLLRCRAWQTLARFARCVVPTSRQTCSVGLATWFKPVRMEARLCCWEPVSSLSKTDAVRIAGIANSSSEGRPLSLVSGALRVLLGS